MSPVATGELPRAFLLAKLFQALNGIAILSRDLSSVKRKSGLTDLCNLTYCRKIFGLFRQAAFSDFPYRGKSENFFFTAPNQESFLIPLDKCRKICYTSSRQLKQTVRNHPVSKQNYGKRGKICPIGAFCAHLCRRGTFLLPESGRTAKMAVNLPNPGKGRSKYGSV